MKILILLHMESWNMLDLLQPIYEKSAAYGHFGREDEAFPWEKTDRSDALKEQSGL